MAYALPSSAEKLSRYEGYYHAYFHALGFPGSLMRSLFRIYPNGNRYYCKSIEHLWDKYCPSDERARFKYSGIVFYLSDRIFIVESEMLLKNGVFETILYPCYRNRINFLSGITLGVGSQTSHGPQCARIEYQYLGKEIDIRSALSACGLYPCDSSEIDERIKKRIANTILPEDYTFTAINH